MSQIRGDIMSTQSNRQNIEELRTAILHMLNNPELAKSCGENAQVRIKEMYSMPTVWHKMCEVWEKIEVFHNFN